MLEEAGDIATPTIQNKNHFRNFLTNYIIGDTEKIRLFLKEIDPTFLCVVRSRDPRNASLFQKFIKLRTILLTNQTELGHFFTIYIASLVSIDCAYNLLHHIKLVLSKSGTHLLHSNGDGEFGICL